MKVAFLDRDGTINKDYADQDWANVRKPEILPGAVEGLRHLNKKGYQIIILTNQYIIGEGIISLEQYRSFSSKLLTILEGQGVSILDIFYCPHARWDECSCFKPRPGLIEQALEKYLAIDLARSFMCGDSTGDIALGHQFGMNCYGINVGSHNRISSLLDLVGLL